MGEREVWDRKAAEWAEWIGDDGDANRRYQSDPVLWRLAGEVRGLRVIDAGCGTGYLTLKLAARGARVVGVDVSAEMIQIARRRTAAKGVKLDFRIESAARLESVEAGSVDLVVSNYVLMDAEDLHGCVASFARVLRAGGRAVCVITHPCFSSRRPGSYFDEQTFEERWGAFVTPFVTHHRPLSRYFAAFFAAGFAVEAFEEPVVALPAPPELAPEKVARYRSLPYSVAVALRKPP